MTMTGPPLSAPLLSRQRAVAGVAFWCAGALTLVLALWPRAAEPPGVLGWDKAEHLLAFAVLGLLAAFAFPRLRAPAVIAGLVGFGVFIELAQILPMIGRDGSPFDVLADAAGAVPGVLAQRWLARPRKP